MNVWWVSEFSEAESRSWWDRGTSEVPKSGPSAGPKARQRKHNRWNVFQAEDIANAKLLQAYWAPFHNSQNELDDSGLKVH